MNAAGITIATADLEAQIEQLKAELDRRKVATDKATWARGKAVECRKQANEVGRQPTHGRMGKDANKQRAVNILRAQAREWDEKAKRFEQQAGIAQPEFDSPF